MTTNEISGSQHTDQIKDFWEHDEAWAPLTITGGQWREFPVLWDLH